MGLRKEWQFFPASRTHYEVAEIYMRSAVNWETKGQSSFACWAGWSMVLVPAYLVTGLKCTSCCLLCISLSQHWFLQGPTESHPDAWQSPPTTKTLLAWPHLERPMGTTLSRPKGAQVLFPSHGCSKPLSQLHLGAGPTQMRVWWVSSWEKINFAITCSCNPAQAFTDVTGYGWGKEAER